MPITIFMIGTFDSLLTNQEENDKVSEEPAEQA